MPTFSKFEHLLTPPEFQLVYDRRRSASDDRLIVYARENELPFSRVGLSVSKKYGNAVRRNRLKRLYRETFRLTKEQLPKNLDLILIPRGPTEPKLEELMKSLPKLVKQVGKKIQKDPPPPPKEGPP